MNNDRIKNDPITAKPVKMRFLSIKLKR